MWHKVCGLALGKDSSAAVMPCNAVNSHCIPLEVPPHAADARQAQPKPGLRAKCSERCSAAVCQ